MRTLSLRKLFVIGFAVTGISSLVAACGGSGGSSISSDNGPGAGGTSSQAGAAGSGGAAAKGGSATGASAGTGVIGASGASAGPGGAAGSKNAGGAAGTMGGSGGQAGSGAGATGGSKSGTSGADGSGCGDTSTDPKNCGKCGNVCQGAKNATAACVDGVCTAACNVGFAACGGDPSKGCETSLLTDPMNCGTCGNVCSAGPNGMSGCYAGKCGIACSANTGDCDGDPSNGCEANFDSDPMNCGACGKVCSGQCISGACQCAGVSAAATPVPLDIYVMLDRSGSMTQTDANGNSRWSTVTGALETFFMSSSANGISVALQYFPQFDQNGTACSASYYYTPAVPMGVVPGSNNSQIKALQASIMATSPMGGTPTNVALQAALQYAADWKKVYPSHTVIVVLSTDGQPGDGCNADINNASAAAAAGFSGTPSIPTYVIGVGPSVGNLDMIAMSGGTTSAFVVNDGNPQAFIQALQAIQSKALGCEYSIPAPQNGTIDYGKVNVQYTPGGGSPIVEDNAASMAACDPTKGGWYYDDPSMPTKIVLCPATCSAVQADPSAQIAIILGCDTQKR